MKDQTIYEKLKTYCAGDSYPFHMPGHKRRLGGMGDPFTIDITEIDGFDNLHHPEGILKDAQERAAALYGAGEAFYLVNGSTAGILAAAAAALSGGKATKGSTKGSPDESGPEILCARNVHKAVCHALYLNRARPVWLYPEMDGLLGEYGICGRISPEQVRRALQEHPGAKAVLITSPTYDGVVSDVGAIAETAHAAGIPLIVDQAHGAHFGLHPQLPENAISLGADLVITSLHKTLPSLTQTGLLLLSGNLISPGTLRRFLAVYQTSSPSYVLMAGMDECVKMMNERGKDIYDQVLSCIRDFREEMKALHTIRLLPTDDPTRILISGGERLSGRAICDILREQFHIEAEMELPGYVLCLAGAGDDAEGFRRLGEALVQIDAAIDAAAGDTGDMQGTRRLQPEAESAEAQRLQAQMAKIFSSAPVSELPIHTAWDAGTQSVPLEESAGRISADFAYLYPPGMPLVIPGERIPPESAGLLARAEKAGFGISGMEDLTGKRIRVVR